MMRLSLSADPLTASAAFLHCCRNSYRISDRRCFSENVTTCAEDDIGAVVRLFLFWSGIIISAAVIIGVIVYFVLWWPDSTHQWPPGVPLPAGGVKLSVGLASGVKL